MKTLVLLAVLATTALSYAKTIYTLPSSSKLNDSTCRCICPDTTTPPPVLFTSHDITMFTMPTTAQYWGEVLKLKNAGTGSDTSWQARTAGGPIILITNSRGVHWKASNNFYGTFSDVPFVIRSYGGATYQSHALFVHDLTNTDIKPKQILFKGGENEMAKTASGLPYSPTWIANLKLPILYDKNKMWIEFLFYNFKNMLVDARKWNPDAKLTYVTMDLSPVFVAAGQTADIQAINRRCKQILLEVGGSNTSVIDIENILVASDYTSDKLHWAASAYAKVAPVIRAGLMN